MWKKATELRTVFTFTKNICWPKFWWWRGRSVWPEERWLRETPCSISIYPSLLCTLQVLTGGCKCHLSREPIKNFVVAPLDWKTTQKLGAFFKRTSFQSRTKVKPRVLTWKISVLGDMLAASRIKWSVLCCWIHQGYNGGAECVSGHWKQCKKQRTNARTSHRVPCPLREPTPKAGRSWEGRWKHGQGMELLFRIKRLKNGNLSVFSWAVLRSDWHAGCNLHGSLRHNHKLWPVCCR